MEEDKEVTPGRVYSPLTLSSEMPTLWRLVIMVFCSCYGVTMGSFFVASFFVQRRLRFMSGFVYHACAGLADMLIMAGAIPLATVVLLSGPQDIFSACQFAQVLTTAASYSYSIFFALLAGETCYGVFFRTHNTTQRASLTVFVLRTCIVVTVFLFSFVLASVGTYMQLDYDYCARRFYGNYDFRIATFVLHGICFFLTMGPLIASYIRIEKIKRQRIQDPTFDLKLFRNMIILSMSAYIVYVAFWTPYLSIVYLYPNAEDKHYYYCAWVGVGRSLVTTMFYALSSSTFGEAYSNIYFYCCCKSSLHKVPRPRHRQYYNHVRSGGISSERTHTHIMQIAVNPYSPQRASTSARDRETLEL